MQLTSFLVCLTPTPPLWISLAPSQKPFISMNELARPITQSISLGGYCRASVWDRSAWTGIKPLSMASAIAERLQAGLRYHLLLVLVLQR